jgi:choice-of-anchor B domain-containing protein
MLERAGRALLLAEKHLPSSRRCAAAFALLALALAFSLSLPESARAVQPNNNFIELAHVDAYAQYNDCWGYRDPNTGNEYAIIGTNTGTSILNITDPFNPYQTGFITGATSGWRDLETYLDNLYVVTEGSGGGLQVIDLSNPEAPAFVRTKGTFTAHTLQIDQDTGIIYCNGVNGGALASSFRAFTTSPNPEDPTVIANRATPYFHDSFTKNGRLYGACINNGGRVDVLRITDMPAYSVMATITYPQGFPGTHNCWTSDDGNYLFTTDESLGSGTVRVFDVADTASILQVNQFPVWTNTCVHNVYVKNDTAWCAWYEEGVLVFDVTDPLNEVQIGSFDTGPDTTGPFGAYVGCWSVYPFLPSNVIVASDMVQGLYLLYYSEAIGTISGTVTDATTGDPIANAEVNVPDFFDRRVVTNANGNYSVVVPGGTHTVIGSAAGYDSDSESVSVADAEVVDHDIALNSQSTGVDPTAGSSGAAARVTLFPPSPNPARDATSLAFELPRGASVSLDVFDASGRRVRTLVDGALPAGRHAIVWDGHDDAGRAVASGAFVTRLSTGSEVRSAKLLLTR